MKEKVFEILVYLMSEIQDNKALHEIDLDELETQGYTQSEISAAFSWIVEHVPTQEDGRIPLEGTGQGSRRILHNAEKLMLTTESQGYLIQLTELGLLDDAGLESVIDRAMATGQDRLTVPELRRIAESVVFGVEHRGAGSGLTMLDPGDTIH